MVREIIDENGNTYLVWEEDNEEDLKYKEITELKVQSTKSESTDNGFQNASQRKQRKGLKNWEK